MQQTSTNTTSDNTVGARFSGAHPPTKSGSAPAHAAGRCHRSKTWCKDQFRNELPVAADVRFVCIVVAQRRDCFGNLAFRRDHHEVVGRAWTPGFGRAEFRKVPTVLQADPGADSLGQLGIFDADRHFAQEYGFLAATAHLDIRVDGRKESENRALTRTTGRDSACEMTSPTGRSIPIQYLTGQPALQLVWKGRAAGKCSDFDFERNL